LTAQLQLAILLISNRGFAAMSPTQVARLTPEERLDLISQLWDSLDDDEVALTSAQQEELDQRLKVRASGHDTTVTWEELRQELQRRLV
jgi:putative addiction module component (TIGR02574 family)